MRLLTRARRAIASTRAPAKPLAENSASAAARIFSRVRFKSRRLARWRTIFSARVNQKVNSELTDQLIRPARNGCQEMNAARIGQARGSTKQDCSGRLAGPHHFSLYGRTSTS